MFFVKNYVTKIYYRWVKPVTTSASQTVKPKKKKLKIILKNFDYFLIKANPLVHNA